MSRDECRVRGPKQKSLLLSELEWRVWTNPANDLGTVLYVEGMVEWIEKRAFHVAYSERDL